MSRSGRMPQHGDDSPWKVLLRVLARLHEQLAANEVPLFLRRKLFLQLFSFINVQLFNQLLLRRECCSFANGEYVKQGLASVRAFPPPEELACCVRSIFHTADCSASGSSLALQPRTGALRLMVSMGMCVLVCGECGTFVLACGEQHVAAGGGMGAFGGRGDSRAVLG
jgi:hypothetical protein